jgi:hypothetical protein
VPADARERRAASVGEAITTAVNPAFERLAAFVDGPYRLAGTRMGSGATRTAIGSIAS